MIEANVREVKIYSPDYKNVDSKMAIDDFLERIRLYELKYEAIDEKLDKHLSFIKIYNVGERFLVNRVLGHIQSRVVYFLMNIRVLPRTIYLTRVSHIMPICTWIHIKVQIFFICLFAAWRERNEFGAEDWRRCTPFGTRKDCKKSLRIERFQFGLNKVFFYLKKYSEKLAEYIKKEDIADLVVWTSQFRRTIQTASTIDAPKEQWKALNEIDAVSQNFYPKFLVLY